jgi:methionine aminotransferase
MNYEKSTLLLSQKTKTNIKLITISSKLPNAGTTIFSIMSGLANETGAINLSQGFPNFQVSPALIELVNDAMKSGNNQYAPMQGLLPLRERISEKIALMYGGNYHPDSEITITAGGTQAINTALLATIHPGDEVIIFEPAYDSYAPSVELAGGKVIPITLLPPTYQIPWNEVKEKISNKTKMIMINSPHNPSGSILSKSDIEELDTITKNTNIIILSDEVYEHIIFDGKQHESIAKYPTLRDRSLLIYSFGKTFHATGWKMGYCVGSAYLMVEFRKVHQFQVFSANTPLQVALATYLKNPDNYSGLESFYQRKRNLFQSLVKDSNFKFLNCSGSYFQLLDFSKITDEKDTDFAKRLTIEHGVASIPLSVFYTDKIDNKLLRFCFSKDDDTLKRAADKLNKVS